MSESKTSAGSVPTAALSILSRASLTQLAKSKGKNVTYTKGTSVKYKTREMLADELYGLVHHQELNVTDQEKVNRVRSPPPRGRFNLKFVLA
jgi:hypothetical protein